MTGHYELIKPQMTDEQLKADEDIIQCIASMISLRNRTVRCISLQTGAKSNLSSGSIYRNSDRNSWAASAPAPRSERAQQPHPKEEHINNYCRWK